VVAGGKAKRRGAKFWAVEKLSKNFLFVEKILSKNAQFEAKNPIWKKFRNKIEHPVGNL